MEGDGGVGGQRLEVIKISSNSSNLLPLSQSRQGFMCCVVQVIRLDVFVVWLFVMV